MSDRAIIEAINKIIGNHKNDQVVYANAIIDSVDLETRSCVCTLVDNHTEHQITAKLMATVDDGLLLIPSLESTVKIILSRDVEPFVCQYSELDKIRIDAVDKIVFNNGEFTTVKGDVLKTEIEKTNSTLQAILTILTGTPIPEPGSGSPSALQSALASALIGKTLGTFTSIENNNILHG